MFDVFISESVQVLPLPCVVFVRCFTTNIDISWARPFFVALSKKKRFAARIFLKTETSNFQRKRFCFSSIVLFGGKFLRKNASFSISFLFTLPKATGSSSTTESINISCFFSFIAQTRQSILILVTFRAKSFAQRLARRSVQQN